MRKNKFAFKSLIYWHVWLKVAMFPTKKNFCFWVFFVFRYQNQRQLC